MIESQDKKYANSNWRNCSNCINIRQIDLTTENFSKWIVNSFKVYNSVIFSRVYSRDCTTIITIGSRMFSWLQIEALNPSAVTPDSPFRPVPGNYELTFCLWISLFWTFYESGIKYVTLCVWLVSRFQASWML